MNAVTDMNGIDINEININRIDMNGSVTRALK